MSFKEVLEGIFCRDVINQSLEHQKVKNESILQLEKEKQDLLKLIESGNSLIEVKDNIIKELEDQAKQVKKDLIDAHKRIVVIEDAKEVPSPLPRLALDSKLLDKIDLLVESKYPGSIMVGVTDTNSMDGWIDFGTQIVLIPFRNDEEKSKVQVGDIIWFHRMSDNSPNVLHRIIEKHDGWVLTRGDNLVENDGPTTYANIKGYLAMIIY